MDKMEKLKVIQLGATVWYKPTMETGIVVSINDATGLFRVHWPMDESYTTESMQVLDDLLFEDTANKYISSINEKVTDDKPESKYNAVSNPKHYDLFPEKGIQVRDLMKVLAVKLDNAGYSGMVVSDYVQAMQYFLRFFDKNGTEDIAKGIWYMDKILEQVKETE